MLKNLRCLCIKQIENVANPAEAKNANLSEKENLFSLSLNWTDGSNSDNSEEIIDKLEPHSDLRELEIEYYKGHRSPIWMRELPPLYLSSLTLFNCPLWEDLPFLAQMPLLNKLSLLGISKVKEVDYSFDMTRNACPFPSLEQLICDKMLKWKSWAGLLSCRGFPKLRVLKITNCPILAELPAMPISLFRFELCNVGLYFLPEMYDNVGMTTGTTSPLNASLKVVKISCCLNLQLLNGFLQQESLEFQGIETLIIQHCDKLVQLPTSSIGKFASLKYLEIIGCPKLDPVDNERILHFVKLQTLVIGNCGELDVKLLKSASHLATLASLHIVGSATINCIPSSENTFTSLRRLHIRGCDNLIQHAVMENAQGNPANNMASLKINELDISHHSLLFIEPIRSLRFVRECRIADCSGMEALPQHWLMQNSSTLELLTFKNARSLRSLPDTIMRLTSLKQLVIKDATSLEQMDQIPKLPPSLFQISITGAGGCELV
ncbi:hypothetical protein LUZ61_012078 [Rhynchospora tenuis]|uniref:R13L1/DRL21-like LRR repeat region domain-containing protein n=1 Tax=Rhynchospora tenuis TaxID=198213 RepID=A0AAD6F159_9POAL|nr:hypothetical protein LUZ61_012078 [Rhynchospora tenuis]